MLNAARNGGIGIAMWAILLVRWLVSGLLIGLGYWVSGLLYSAGLWPLGAILRVFLLLGFLGWALYAVYLVFMLVMIPMMMLSDGED